MKFEKELTEKGYRIIAGVDEAGRGPLAGPVIAAAAVLPPDFDFPEITDSKKLTEKKREEFFDIIYKYAVSVGVGQVDAEEIDRINILQATHKAMKLALLNLSVMPDIALVDGLPAKGLPCPQKAVVKGDSLIKSISAASIIAKVTRDRLMKKYDEIYPNYGFAKHKGYATAEHTENIKKYGPCSIHRMTFEPIWSMTHRLDLF